MTKGATTIMNDVCIGHDSIILSGVNIGYGAVVGAASVVTKNIPDYAIVASNPERIIRYRFTTAQIEKLLDIAWWDMDIKVVCATVSLLLSNDVDKFIAVMSKIIVRKIIK